MIFILLILVLKYNFSMIAKIYRINRKVFLCNNFLSYSNQDNNTIFLIEFVVKIKGDLSTSFSFLYIF